MSAKEKWPEPTPEIVLQAGRNFVDRTHHWPIRERATLFSIISASYCLQCGAERHIGASLGIPSCLCGEPTATEVRAGMSDPAKEIQELRKLSNLLAQESCNGAIEPEDERKQCPEIYGGEVKDYCPSCVARHTLKNL